MIVNLQEIEVVKALPDCEKVSFIYRYFEERYGQDYCEDELSTIIEEYGLEYIISLIERLVVKNLN